MQLGKIAVTAVQARQAIKTSLKQEMTELDVALMAMAGILQGGSVLFKSNNPPPQAKLPRRPTDPKPVAPAPAVLGSEEGAYWKNTPAVRRTKRPVSSRSSVRFPT